MNVGERLFPIIGSLVNDEIYPLIRPETAKGKPPYIIYTPISSQSENSLDGFLGHEYAQIQIDIYHSDYDELDRLTHQVIKAINDNITPSEFLGRQHLYDDDSELFRQSLDYQFWTSIFNQA